MRFMSLGYPYTKRTKSEHTATAGPPRGLPEDGIGIWSAPLIALSIKQPIFDLSPESESNPIKPGLSCIFYITRFWNYQLLMPRSQFFP